jgi:dipeptidyl aminopeptidase/acylaminoacyl peptidase
MLRSRNLFTGFLLLLSFSTAFAQKTAITHESMWALKRVGAPIPSPDGKWVLFSLIEPAYDEKDQTSDLWIVPADGGAKPRRLTSTRAAESGAEWSPDGTRIAFSAKRETDEVNQIYVLDIGGGEAVRVTNVSTGGRSPRWRPDGKAILFISSVFPGAMNDDDNKRLAKEKKDRKYKARVFDSFPVRNWDKWLDEMQTHVLVQGLEDGAKPRDLLAGTKLVAEKGFGGRIGSGSDDIDAVWSPDGESVLFIASTDRASAAFSETTLHIYSVKTSGGEPKRLTGGQATYGRPTFSPDGKTLYALYEPIGPKVYNLTRLAEIPWPGGGNAKVLTTGFDRSVGSFALSPDSRTIYLTAEDSGHEKVYRMGADDDRVYTLTEAIFGCYTNLAVASKGTAPALFLNWDSANNPPEILRLDVGSEKSGKSLTNFNAAALAKIDMEAVKEFWFTSRAANAYTICTSPRRISTRRKNTRCWWSCTAARIANGAITGASVGIITCLQPRVMWCC